MNMWKHHCFYFTWLSYLIELTLRADVTYGSCVDTKDLRWLRPAAGKYDGYIPFLVGEWWKVDCRLNSNNVSVTLWRKALYTNNPHEQVPNEKVHETETKNVFNISTLTLADRGTYYCKACGITKYLGGILTRKGVAFAKPIAIRKPNVSRLSFGSKAALECSVNGCYREYKIEWFKVGSNGEKELLPSKDTSVWRSVNDKVQRKILTFSNVSKKDEGIYMCQISRFAVHYFASDTIELILEDVLNPKILNFTNQQYIAVKEHGNISFNYNVIGTPHPHITWFKERNGKIEKIAWFNPKSNLSYSKIPGITNDRFTIEELSYEIEHNVTYICQAWNGFGNSTRKFSVWIKTKPSLKATHETNLTVQIYKEGMDLHCVLAGYNNDVEFTWQKCTITILPADQNWITLGKCPKQNTWENIAGQVIHGSVWESRYKVENQKNRFVLYRCSASNGIGVNGHSWIIVKPEEKCVNARKRIGAIEEDDDGAAIWRFATICMGILLLFTLFAVWMHEMVRGRKQVHLLSKKDLVYVPTHV